MVYSGSDRETNARPNAKTPPRAEALAFGRTEKNEGGLETGVRPIPDPAGLGGRSLLVVSTHARTLRKIRASFVTQES
jgi:hypothetical protein